MQNEQRFLDNEGRLQQWPSKQPDKQLALAYLAAKFDFDAAYTEAEVNELLKQWHTFNDWPLLRRELYERGFLERNTNGSNYHIKHIQTSLPDFQEECLNPHILNVSIRDNHGHQTNSTIRLQPT